MPVPAVEGCEGAGRQAVEGCEGAGRQAVEGCEGAGTQCLFYSPTAHGTKE